MDRTTAVTKTIDSSLDRKIQPAVEYHSQLLPKFCKSKTAVCQVRLPLFNLKFESTNTQKPTNELLKKVSEKAIKKNK